MAADHPTWENLYFDTGRQRRNGFRHRQSGTEEIRRQNHRAIAEAEKKTPLDALFDFINRDKGKPARCTSCQREKIWFTD